MDEQELAAIEARASQATAGPWHNDNDYRVLLDDGGCIVETKHMDASTGLDSAFIAASRQDVPTLCAALREAWDRIALLEEHPLIELTVQMPIVDEPPHRNRFAEFYRRGGGQS